MSEASTMNPVSARLSAALRGLLAGTNADGSEIRMPQAAAVREAFAVMAEAEAAGQHAEKPLRNDPLSALAIRLLVGTGQVTQEQANEAFRVACQAMEDEARRLDMTLPWVTAEKPGASESKAAPFVTISHQHNPAGELWLCVMEDGAARPLGTTGPVKMPAQWTDAYRAALEAKKEAAASGRKGDDGDSELRRSVKAMAALLSGMDWAEHVSSDKDAQDLEAQITRVIGELEGLRQQVQARGPATDEQLEQPRLAVRLTSFPESNGKRNWTALLVRADAWDGLVGNCGGVSLARGELWNRVAYHAECARLLIGERDTEPHILDYGDDIETPEQWAGEVHGGRALRRSVTGAAGVGKRSQGEQA